MNALYILELHVFRLNVSNSKKEKKMMKQKPIMSIPQGNNTQIE